MLNVKRIAEELTECTGNHYFSSGDVIQESSSGRYAIAVFPESEIIVILDDEYLLNVVGLIDNTMYHYYSRDLAIEIESKINIYEKRIENGSSNIISFDRRNIWHNGAFDKIYPIPEGSKYHV